MARILAEAQTKLGMNSKLYSVIETDLRNAPLSSPAHTAAAAIDQYAIKNPKFNSPLSLIRDSINGVGPSSLDDSDVIHLHGVSGVLNPAAIEDVSRGKRTIWTLHDMNPFTGGCHYSLGCAGFRTTCSLCPAVRPIFQSKISKNLSTKVRHFSEINNLAVIAPSAWLAEEARRSATFNGADISVISNPVNPVFLATDERPVSSDEKETFRTIAVAKNLSDPVKDIDFAVQAFRAHFRDNARTELVLVGKGGKEFEGPGIRLVGEQSSKNLAEEFSRADALIVSSKAENAPLVVAEASVRGCIPIIRSGVGGMDEMISSIGFGHSFSDAPGLTSLLNSLAGRSRTNSAASRKKISNAATQLFSPEAVAREYGKVY